MFWVTFSMALREIRRNWSRSLLTALGIIIGVAAVIAMVTLGRGATASVMNDIAKMGDNLLIVAPGSDRRGPVSTTATAFKQADARAIEREVSAVHAIAPAVSVTKLVVYGNRNFNTTVHGSTNAYFTVSSFELASGRNFSESELLGGTPVCVVGATVRSQLFGLSDPVGENVRIGNVSCRVIGLLKSKGKASMGQDQDDLVVMPLAVVQRRFAGNSDIGMFLISAKSSGDVDRAKQQITALLRERRRIAEGQADDFSVQGMDEIARTLGSVTGALTALLGAIAAVSLLVGGIGIMNIMLVSVTERTAEVGLRLAIGGSGREVLLQFLVEAVTLSTFGGIVGIAIGAGLSALVSALFGLPLVLGADVVLIAVGFSGVVGVAFGYFPARKAARLNPIEALRHE